VPCRKGVKAQPVIESDPGMPPHQEGPPIRVVEPGATSGTSGTATRRKAPHKQGCCTCRGGASNVGQATEVWGPSPMRRCKRFPKHGA